MFQERKRTEMVALPESNGCSALREGSGHTIYRCACGHLPRHRKISSGVVQSIEKQLARLPKGWIK